MKKTALLMSGALVVGLMIPRPAVAQFGLGDIIYLIELVKQAQQSYQLAQQAQQSFMYAANFFQHPNWRYMLSSGLDQAAAIAQKSDGSDLIIVNALDHSMQTANAALREASTMAQTSTNDAGLLSLLQLQEMQAKMERDRIAAHLQFNQDVDRYAALGTGLGNVASSIQGWQLK